MLSIDRANFAAAPLIAASTVAASWVTAVGDLPSRRASIMHRLSWLPPFALFSSLKMDLDPGHAVGEAIQRTGHGGLYLRRERVASLDVAIGIGLYLHD